MSQEAKALPGTPAKNHYVLRRMDMSFFLLTDLSLASPWIICITNPVTFQRNEIACLVWASQDLSLILGGRANTWKQLVFFQQRIEGSQA
jgi:hypothetical protein